MGVDRGSDRWRVCNVLPLAHWACTAGAVMRSACISYDWVVAAYIFIYYRVASRQVLNPER